MSGSTQPKNRREVSLQSGREGCAANQCVSQAGGTSRAGRPDSLNDHRESVAFCGVCSAADAGSAHPAVSYGFGTCSQSTTRLEEIPVDLDGWAPMAEPRRPCHHRAQHRRSRRSRPSSRLTHIVGHPDPHASAICITCPFLVSGAIDRFIGDRVFNAGARRRLSMEARRTELHGVCRQSRTCTT